MSECHFPTRRLNEVCRVVRGGSPRPAGDPRYFGGSVIPWLTVAALTNVSDAELTVHGAFGFLTEEGAKRSRMLSAGTVIISNSGATLGVAKILGFDCCANDGIAALAELSEADPRFFCYWLNTQTEVLRTRTATGNGQPNLNTTMIGNLMFPCPPLPEQQAIAAALSDADGVVAGLERVIAKKRLIKQGARQDLLTARRRLPGFSGEWEEATISDVAHVDPEALGAGTPKDYAFRYISLEDVNQGVLSGWRDVAFGSAPSRARRILQKNDVLLGTVRPNLKSHMLFDRLGADWVGSTGFAVLRPRPEKCISGYLFELIMSDVIGRQIDEVIAGSNYPAISNSDVRKLKVLLPSVDEQKAIAAVLRDMDAEIQTLESRLVKARAVKEGMMQNLLTGRVRLV